MAKRKSKPYRRRATTKQKNAVKNLVENGGNVSKAMRDANYSAATAKTPQKLTESKAFKDLMNDLGLDDTALAKKHEELLNSHRLDHMVFPLGPKEDTIDEENEEEEQESSGSGEHTTMTDKQITEMLASVNCTVRRIVHGELARHVYFWAPDNKARKDGLDMAYKIKGHYAPEKLEHSGGLSLSALFKAAQDAKSRPTDKSGRH